MPKQEARTNWDMDRVVTMDMEAHDWDTPIAWELLYPDEKKETFLRRDRDSNDPTEDVIDEMLRRKNRNTTFVAHNGGGYDFIPLIRRLIRRDDVVVKLMLDDQSGDIWYVEFDNKDSQDRRQTRRLQDSMKIMPRGLANLSEDMAEDSKIEPELFNVEDLPPALNDMDADARDEMLKYLHYDCKSLRQCLETFTDIVTDISGGKVGTQLTVGSTTMSMYQVAFMEDEPDAPTGIYRSSEDAETAMRDAYYGGRTEVFRHHAPEGEYYHFDVNSLYPYVYTKKPVPAGKVTHYDPEMTQRIESMIKSERANKGGAVKIEGFVPHDTDIPVLPVRSDATPNADTHKVVFPTGYIEGWYSVAELEYALSIGAIEDVTYKEAYLAPRHKPFKNYGGRLYEQKQNIDKSENPARYKVVKFLLNSFYGKFGMSREQSQLVQIDNPKPANKYDERVVGVELKANGKANMDEKYNLYRKEDTADASYIRPRVAMAITAYARIEMHKWIRGIRQHGGRVWYCDTDSIVTDLDIRDREHDIHLGVGEDFGEMDLEETPTEAVFLAPKTYAEREDEELLTMKAKGMKDPDWTFDQMREQLQNSHDPLETTWESVRGAKASLKRDNGLTKVEHTRGVTSLDDKRSHDTRNPTELSDPWNIAKREYEQQRKNAEETQSQRLKQKLRHGWNRLMSGQARDSKARKDSHLNARENKREEMSRRVNAGKDLKLKRERQRR
jgi:hypothetical protein